MISTVAIMSDNKNPAVLVTVAAQDQPFFPKRSTLLPTPLDVAFGSVLSRVAVSKMSPGVRSDGMGTGDKVVEIESLDRGLWSDSGSSEEREAEDEPVLYAVSL
ncbi:hypothetical protein SLEP1_g28415 [Rubroshorea leprosula]|uniref:Uncharacterized protein n=1 Tax=Rubroshorea leprosula TaxID=152421 RepID=A0AAV5K3C0_9ROSI|nr:hypothetical protein SLEP1_g28415 [Rubroshorea leprosula]